MRVNKKCPKCGSTNIILKAQFNDRAHLNFTEQATVTTYTNPLALIFKGRRHSTVSADICEDCGFMELYAAL
jgi:predicted nucleic-acid-binding Zn-ribbon protein